MKKTPKKQKGFTLIEVLVATFIFLIIMTSVVAIFARQSTNFAFLQVQQRNIENAQFAINFVGKTLRTSSVRGETSLGTGTTSKRLYVFDHSQGKCFKFVFDDSAGTFLVTSRPPDPADPLSCGRDAWVTGSTASQVGEGPFKLTTGFTEGYFDAVETSRDIDDNPDNGNQFRIGLITMRLKVSGDNLTASDTWVQTSVSLRDYPSELKF